MEHLDMVDQGVNIAQALRSREVIAVSDGSFKNEYGTAAWVIEGDSSYGTIHLIEVNSLVSTPF
jgi:hypothetical protein